MSEFDEIFDDILSAASDYLAPKELDILRRAYEFAGRVYSGKHRLSGKPYIVHSLAVANILAKLRLDYHTVVAGLLHGTLKKEFSTTEKELAKEFGKDVATIVSGATKINNVQFDSTLAFQAENVRKMLLAMSADIRVLIVKLADRLHDMQTLQFAPKKKQHDFASETMDLYAPLASRLGIDWIKRELEDLSFSFLYPDEYKDLAGKISTTNDDRQRYIDEVKAVIAEELNADDITDFRILGRPKHLYSIYKKLIVQNIPLEKVYDKVAFRIILKDVRECYEVLGILHSLWSPVAGRFKDFISTPKGNMYQSLHTTVVGPYREFMEVQIRTEEMDEIANDGIAAHWAYKEGKSVISQKDARLFQWLKQLVHSLQEFQDPREFMEAVKGELHEAEVYALTPNGEVREFPAGSTPIDFAYAVHTEVGDHCAGARINGRIVPLKHQLKNGDVVEIITAHTQQPNRGWLPLVRTSRAKSRIRHWLKREEQERTLVLGREICERELRKHKINLKKLIKTGHFKEILKKLSCNSLDDLMRKVGKGKLTTQTIIDNMLPPEVASGGTASSVDDLHGLANGSVLKKKEKGTKVGAFSVDGVEGLLVRVSKCCLPVPGDDIKGFITAGRGISIHKADCVNFLATDPQRRVDVSWSEDEQATHRVQVQLVAEDQKGLLGVLSNAISADDANIVSLDAHTSSANLAVFNLVIEVASLRHLGRLLQHLRQVPGVLEARRR